jgi:two-component system sensor histidine kinase ChiS
MSSSRFPRFIIALSCVLAAENVAAQMVVNGYADLSTFDFARNGPAELSGEWEFYYDQLLTPREFPAQRSTPFVSVPGSWHLSGEYSAIGVATYRIRIKLPPEQFGLSLYFRIVNASAKIWLNGQLVQESGVVSANQNEYKPSLKPTIVSLPEKAADIDLIVQVANFSYYSAGLAGTPEIDKSSATFIRINRTNGIENFFAGSLIAMFIYQLILYFLFDRGKPYLWLALICLGVALRAMIVHGGSFLLPMVFPEIGWELWKKVEFGSVYAIIALFPLYVRHLFPDNAPKKPIYGFLAMSGIMCFTVLVTPQYFYGSLLEFAHLGLLLAFIYAFYSITRAWKAGSRDARIILIGVLASFPFIMTEILKNSVFFPIPIYFNYAVEMGVLVFLLFQVYLLANHYANAYKNLEAMNLDLEKVVAIRTTQLTTANTVKDRLLSVMSHDIKSPLNSLRGLLQVYNKGSITPDEFGKFARHVEEDLSRTNLLVENILFWTASQLKGLQIKKEKFNFCQLVEENVQLFQTIASSKRLAIHNNMPGELFVFSDRNILNFVMRNLIANAIKFSFEGGEITIVVKLENRILSCHVHDKGIGMDEETLRQLMSGDQRLSMEGTESEQGTGLGLALCRDYLLRAGGELTVESIKEQGSVFSFTIPAA